MKNWIAQVCRTLRAGLGLLKIFYRLFARPKKIWRSPPKCEVLTYDTTGSESLIHLIGTHSLMRPGDLGGSGKPSPHQLDG